MLFLKYLLSWPPAAAKALRRRSRLPPLTFQPGGGACSSARLGTPRRCVSSVGAPSGEGAGPTRRAVPQQSVCNAPACARARIAGLARYRGASRVAVRGVWQRVPQRIESNKVVMSVRSWPPLMAPWLSQLGALARGLHGGREVVWEDKSVKGEVAEQGTGKEQWQQEGWFTVEGSGGKGGLLLAVTFLAVCLSTIPPLVRFSSGCSHLCCLFIRCSQFRPLADWRFLFCCRLLIGGWLGGSHLWPFLGLLVIPILGAFPFSVVSVCGRFSVVASCVACLLLVSSPPPEISRCSPFLPLPASSRSLFRGERPAQGIESGWTHLRSALESAGVLFSAPLATVWCCVAGALRCRTRSPRPG